MFNEDPRSRIAARSRCASSARAARWASRRSPCTATPTRARRTCARPTRRCTSAPPPSRESYLQGRPDHRGGASASAREAIHPGYGFLSEREWFARAVRDAGLVFIGPPAEAIAAMGSKTAARQLAIERERARRARHDRAAARTPTKRREIAERVRLSGAAQGRGRRRRQGHARRARAAASWRSSLDAARREAKNAFGDDAVYVEKYIAGPRHVEIQVLGDQHGTMLLARRARVLGAAAPSEDDRGGAERRGVAGAAPRDGRDGRARGEGRGLRERRHVRVSARRERQVLLPRDEHAAPGRASGHGARDGHRSRAVADPHRRRRAACRSSRRTSCRAAGRSSAASRARIRRTAFFRRPGASRTCTCRADRACAGTAASKSGSEIGLYYDPMLAKLIV